MADYSSWAAAIVANLIGGLVFFWIDKWIFKPKRDYTKLLARVDEEMEATKIRECIFQQEMRVQQTLLNR